jgi:GrpB-like predicted nucleotidyltransferase (UPF0157 family)
VIPDKLILFGHKRDINLVDDVLKLRVMVLKNLRNHPLAINNEHFHFSMKGTMQIFRNLKLRDKRRATPKIDPEINIISIT